MLKDVNDQDHLVLTFKNISQNVSEGASENLERNVVFFQRRTKL